MSGSEIPESVEIQKHLSSVRIDEWLENDVFKARWWILLALFIVSFLVWWLLLDKSRLKEVCLYTALFAIVSLGLNEYGLELVLWDYPTDIIAIFPPLSSMNLIILPLAYSIVYQYCTTKKRFVWAAIITSAAICFVVEPLLSWGGLYALLNWRYYWSFPLFAAIAMLVRQVTVKINHITKNAVALRR